MLMIAQLGFLALLISSAVLFSLFISPLKQSKHLLRYACLAIFFAYSCLTLCFLGNEFHLQYVAQHSSTLLPWFYRICAVWGGHEGSVLLWLNILALFAFVLSWQVDTEETRLFQVLAVIMQGLLGFIILTSNPFHLQFLQSLKQGFDLNPLLQDPGFLFHPPMLYLGYVGYAIPFALAMTSLITGKIDKSTLQLMKVWSIFAWSCLSLGITLGSWWAYRELGWGGFWFWDPVENASLMPWLIGTALLHALMMSEKQGTFLAWTLLLSIAAFCLSLIGTFLVRSGVLTSVHAFATDPARGMYILGFLAIMMLWSFVTYAWRSHKLFTHQALYWCSRESGILINNLLLVITTLVVLLGTIYPLIIDGLNLGKISVGAPYFNQSLAPILLIFLIFMALGIQVKWQVDQLRALYLPSTIQLGMAAVIAGLITQLAYQQFIFSTWLFLSLALWVSLSVIYALLKRIHRDGHIPRSLSFWAMFCAHMGFAASIFGIIIASSFGEEIDLSMRPKEVIQLHGYQIKLIEEQKLEAASYYGTRVKMGISRGHFKQAIYPEKRIYRIGNVVMTDADIDYNLWRDIYVALGSPVGDDAWSLRIYYKPCIRFIWLGGILICAAGLIALIRYVQVFYKRRR